MMNIFASFLLLILIGCCTGAPNCLKLYDQDAINCCNFSGEDNDTEIINKCEQNMKGIKKPLGCLIECLYNETNVFTNKKLELAKVEILPGEFPEEEELSLKAFKTCQLKVDEIMMKSPTILDQRQCKYSLSLGVCVSREVLANCPTRMWNNTPTCVEYRKLLEVCTLEKQISLLE